MNVRTEENVTRKPLHKNPRALEKRSRESLLLFTRFKNLFWDTKTKIPLKKMNEMLDCLKDFWKWRTKKDNLRILQRLSWMNTLSNLSSPFHAKDGNEYEPTFLRSLMASFGQRILRKRAILSAESTTWSSRKPEKFFNPSKNSWRGKEKGINLKYW